MIDRLSREHFLTAEPDVRSRGWIYRSLNVEPIVNCVGTQTNFGGSQPSAVVVNAMAAAAEAFVDLDELAEGVGRRLGRLTGAQWGIVTAGSTAALSLATAACLAGNDPELMLRLPHLGGLPRRVLIPEEHRFDYDHIMTVVGAEVGSFLDLNDLARSLDTQPRMICMLGRALLQGVGPALEDVRKVAEHVPIIIDAAGLSPQSPDAWLQRGADLVIYSGGKFLRGPHSTGFLLGREDLCRAAWLNGPPHQSFGRAMKVGKEEIIGALAALEAWLIRSENDDQAKWDKTLAIIEKEAVALGLETQLLKAQPFSLVPRLRITWRKRYRYTADYVRRMAFLMQRVRFPDFWSMGEAIEINPFNMTGVEDINRVVLCLREIFGRIESPQSEAGTMSGESFELDVSGSWKVSIEFLGQHREDLFHLSQTRGWVRGTHKSRRLSGIIIGRMSSNGIVLNSRHVGQPLTIYHTFRGIPSEGALAGELTVGAASDEHRGLSLCSQFGRASWQAVRIKQSGAKVPRDYDCAQGR
ncbi:hypothetical protein [Mesorhizobium captivum]|uniref:hypothetical protein n=1 Tax=Mesorhizobium captivum TaxID=3072319 RepID=UPI002A24D900|nr:hypothetical protein [Mesorhizobium sp. VK3C]MDX8450232.1 hypothetical protein [Mesorhizobium sp. VK3C]